MGSADFAKSIFLRPVELAEALERLAADFEAAEAQYWRGSGVDDSIPNRLRELAEAVELAAEGGLSPIAAKFREGGLDLRAVAEGLQENHPLTLPQLGKFPAQMKRCADSLRQWLEWKAYRQRLESISVDELFGDLSEPQKPAPAAAPADSATPHVPAPQPSAEGAADTQPGSALPPSPDAAAAPQGASVAAGDSIDRTEVNAEALAVHCGCSPKKIRDLLKNHPARIGGRGVRLWQYGEVLETLREWSAEHRVKGLRVLWPEQAAELRKRRK